MARAQQQGFPAPVFAKPDGAELARREAAPEAFAPNLPPIPTAQVGGVWTSMGPAPTRSGQVTVPPNNEIAGAIQAIAVHPTNPAILYIGAVNGGVWRTANATAATPTWTPLTDTQGSQSIGAVEFDPTDATFQTLVAGSARTSSYGAVGGATIGVLRTTDGGNTWTALGGSTFSNEHLTSVAARGNIIMAGSDNQWSGGGGNGLFRSTDGGASFIRISGGSGTGLPTGPVSDLVGDPTVTTRFYVAVRTAGIYRSDDSGATWTNVTTGITGITSATTKVEMAVHNNGTTNAVWVGVINNNVLASVWRSTTLGASWTQLDTPPAFNGAQGQIHFGIAADRASANIVYISGDRIAASPFTGNIFRGDATLATGSQFVTIVNGNAGNTTPHADSRELVMDANGNLIEGDDGGLYRRTSPLSSAGTWGSVIGNLAVFEAHDVAYDSVAHVGMVGTQDNGTHIESANGSLIWTFIAGGDGGDVAIDDRSTPGQSIRYGSSQNLGGFFRRTYNAANAQVSSTSPALTVLNGGAAIGVQFTTPIELNEVDATRLIIGGSNSAYESLNRGDTVTALADGFGVNGTFTGNPIAYGGMLTGVPNPDVLYYGSGSAVRVRTTAGGAITNTTAAFPGGTVQDIVLDTNDWRRVFAAGSSSVYVSANSGGAWTNITGNLTGVGSIHTLEFFRLSGVDCVAAGTDVGVFCSFVDNLGTWSRLGSGLPNVLVYDMTFSAVDSVLVVGTLGRSTFRLPIVNNTATVTLPASVTEGGASGTGTVTLNPIPTANVTVTLSASVPARLSVPATVVVTSGQASANFTVSAVNDAILNGSTTVQVDATAASYGSVPGFITVIDNETTTLTVTLPATAVEGATGLTGTVTTAANVGANVAVSLSSNDTTELIVPASVTILSGQNTATFPLTIVDDGIVDGTQTPTVTAQVAGWTSGSRSMSVTDAGVRNFLTELFDNPTTDVNDTAGATYAFTPVATSSGYTASRVVTSTFPTDPTGGTAVAAGDDTSSAVALTGGALVRLFGVDYGTVFIGSNGYLTFGSGDTTFGESIAAHYSLPRVSALFDDLDVSAGGSLTYRQLADRLAVTWQAVPEFNTSTSNNFQIEMFFDGRISITILAIGAVDGLIGVSPGGGTPANFVETNFSGLPGPFLIGPTVSSIANQTILEDQATSALGFTVNDDRTASASLVLSALSSNTTLVPVGNIVFGGSGGNRTVTASPAANQNGSATITVRVTDGDGNTTSVPFSLTVTAVNDAPSFTRGSSQIVLEDATAQTVSGWATALSAGPADESSQVLNFIVSNNNNALFSAQPAVAANGTLTFTPAANASGSATVTVQIHDNGGIANGGVDTSAVQTFTIAVTAVNDVPTFTKGANQSVLEDAGARSVAAWATAISPGPADESGQALDFIVSNTNNALFSAQPAVAANGTLTFTPTANASGSATVTVQIHDNGGGVDTSAAQTFTITVTAVNDAPSFVKGANSTVLEDAGAQTIPGWATALSAGPADESGQALNFIVSNDNAPLFASAPAVSAGGALTFLPAPNANGTATVTVQIHDNGGTANGGLDTSTAQIFTINVTPVNDAPTLSAIANPAAILEDAPGVQTVSLAGISTGPVNETQTLTVTATSDNPALIPTPSIAYTSPGATGSVNYAPAANMSGTATITVRVQDDGGTANGGVDAVTQTFTVTVTGVNDAPSFTRVPDSTVLEDAGAQTIPGWASALSAGPADENGQSLNFVVSSDNAALFSSAPAVSPTGALSFTAAPDANGTATVTVQIHDDGGTANGGVDTSAAQTFTINVTAVNDPPTLNALAPMTVAEDAAEQSVPLAGIGTGAANESQTLVVTATSSDPAIVATPSIDFTSPNATGTLRFTPVANANGSATITVTVNDGGAENPTATRTFTVNVTAVNDSPAFTKGTDQIVNEDSGAQTVAVWAGSISAGPPDEAAQALDFIVSNDNAALFTSPPAVSATGALSYTLTPDANGFATVTVLLHDDGGTANGGADTSEPQTFTITVVPVNDPPSFVKGADQSARQNAGAQRVPGWATNLSAGPADESGQALDFIVSNDNPALFSVPPAIGPDGALTFTPSAGASGTATVTVMLHDNGGTTPGIDTSAAQTFLISTTFVNDAPSFTSGGDQSAAEETGPQTIDGWASAISPGPADEAAQIVNFILDVSDPTIFTTAPAISPNGTLTFTPRPGASGSAVITVRLHDTGGIVDGGVDTSDPITFTIFVTSFREEIGTYNGLVRSPDSVSPAHSRAGLIRVTVAKSGALTGKLALGGVSYKFKGRVDNGGVAHFGRNGATSFALVHRGQPARSFSFKIDVARGTDTLTGMVTDGTGTFAKVEADRALFSGKKIPVAPLMSVPSDLLGKYTVLLAAKSPAEESRAAMTFPQGDGFGFVKVIKSGAVKIVGTLADGTKFSYANALSKNGTWPFYVRLLSGSGSISGPVAFRSQPGISDLDGLDLDWFKSANPRAKRYPTGWPTGIHPDLIGGKYIRPAKSENISVLSGLAPSTPTGNATVTLSDAGLPPAGIEKAVNIDPKNKVTVVTPGSDKLDVNISPANGGFSGKFKDPGTGKTLTFKGAILQTQQLGSGFFLTPAESGAATGEPR